MSLLLCSCATKSLLHPSLPATQTLNKDAGRGDLLIVPFRLANGEKLLLAVDTGSPVTLFDKSLAPKLGTRLETGTLMNFGVSQEINVYAEPKLYLGKVQLQTSGKKSGTFDRQKLAVHGWPSIMGIVGMDVLHNYCIQMDFAAGKMRFLDDENADKKNWGEPFPLTDIGDGCFSINENLIGVKSFGSIVDTGCNSSGWLRPELLQQWTNQALAADEKVHSPDGVLGGAMYHDLDLRELNAKSLASDDAHIKLNGIGLRALAENLVTLDFPKRMMYLKHTTDWPQPARDLETAINSAGRSSAKLLKQLLKNGKLPGATKDDHGKVTTFHFNHDAAPYLDTATWDAVKNGDSSIYHFTFTRTAKNNPWKLQKAWQTDQNGHTIKEYIPT